MKSTQNLIHIFFDMDGTLSKFYEDAKYLELMWEKGFFRDLKPYENAVKAVKLLVLLAVGPYFRVHTLSATQNGQPYERAEKEDWAAEHIGTIGTFFMKAGTSKAAFIVKYYDRPLTSRDILVDDYSKNLVDWEANGGKGVKFKNGLNARGINGYNFRGAHVTHTNTPAHIAAAILDAAGIRIEDAISNYIAHEKIDGEDTQTIIDKLGEFLNSDELQELVYKNLPM